MRRACPYSIEPAATACGRARGSTSFTRLTDAARVRGDATGDHRHVKQADWWGAGYGRKNSESASWPGNAKAGHDLRGRISSTGTKGEDSASPSGSDQGLISVYCQ